MGSLHAKGVEIDKMDSRNDKKDGNFRWTDKDVIAFCEVCIEYVRKNGRGQAFKWHDIHTELENHTKRKFQFKSLKNKFDAMRADWYMWKFLKTGETGLGWAGTAHDTRVFLHAINTPELNFPKPPHGRYYLADKGYPDRNGYLVPYPKTRYHKSQFEKEPPGNSKEAFNKVHSSLRSCIERSFGVLKKRWKILHNMPKFNVETQIDVMMATFALHNYIRINSDEDLLFSVLEQYPDYIPDEELPDVGVINDENTSESSKEMKKIRDEIATLIWAA